MSELCRKIEFSRGAEIVLEGRLPDRLSGSAQTSKMTTANGPNKEPLGEPIFPIAMLKVRIVSRAGGLPVYRPSGRRGCGHTRLERGCAGAAGRPAPLVPHAQQGKRNHLLFYRRARPIDSVIDDRCFACRAWYRAGGIVADGRSLGRHPQRAHLNLPQSARRPDAQRAPEPTHLSTCTMKFLSL
jgi:hypothetical protein